MRPQHSPLALGALAISLGLGTHVAWAQAVPDKLLPKAEAQGATAQQSTQQTAQQTAQHEPSLTETIAQVQSRLEQALAALSPLAPGAAKGAPPPPGATPEEWIAAASLRRETVRNLQLRLDAYKKQQALLAALDDLHRQMASWTGFESPPPYPIDLGDGLWADIVSARKALETLQVERSLITGTLDEASAERTAAEQALRQIEEASPTGAGGVKGDRQRWLHDLARLRTEASGTAVAALEAQRRATELALKHDQEALTFLQRKFATASQGSLLSEADRDAKIKAAAERGDAVHRELAEALKTEEGAHRRLAQARDELQAARLAAAMSREARVTGQAPASERTPSDLERLDRVVNARGAEAETADARVGLLRLLIQVAGAEEDYWRRRYDAAHTHDAARLREALEYSDAKLAKLTQWKRYLGSRLDDVQRLASDQETELANAAPGDARRDLLQAMLTTYRERLDLIRRVLEQADRVEALLLRWREELVERRAGLSWGERLSAAARTALGQLSALWNYELFVVEDNVVVDGEKVTAQRSVTVRKVATIIGVILLGVWLAMRAAALVAAVLSRRFAIDESGTVLVSRLVYIVLIVTLLLAALSYLSIPLTAFAFLGGALAIGAGFGAQNLINNFISGMILLLERPIRLGDVVEVEGVRGRVTRIGGRCCQVRRFDGIDILVPNSVLLERNVTNWTFSDNIISVSIKLGVAYGSPTRDTARLIMEAVQEHGKVLSEPAPQVMFEDFGDNALIFNVSFWMELGIPAQDRRIASDVRFMIERKLREAGITMAFPQRDIHIDTPAAIRVEVVGGAAAAQQAGVSGVPPDARVQGPPSRMSGG